MASVSKLIAVPVAAGTGKPKDGSKMMLLKLRISKQYLVADPKREADALPVSKSIWTRPGFLPRSTWQSVGIVKDAGAGGRNARACAYRAAVWGGTAAAAGVVAA